jgi:hypothetical protein
MGRKASLLPSRAAWYLPELLAHQAVLHQHLRLERPMHRTYVRTSVSSFGDWLYILALGIPAYEITG